MAKPLDLTKPVQTRNGRAAKIAAVLKNPKHNYPIFAVVTERDGSESTSSHTLAGGLFSAGESPSDLVNVPEKIEYLRYVNIYAGGPGQVLHLSKAEADILQSPGRLACLEIKLEGKQGDGL